MSDIFNNIELLESLMGMSKDAFQTYKEILISPPNNLSKLAGKVGLSRASLYKVLNELESEQLIFKPLNHPNKAKYLAADPNILMDKLNLNQRKVDEDVSTLKQHIFYLKNIDEGKDRSDPTIQMIKGSNLNDQLDRIIVSKGKPLSGFSYMYHLDACFDFDNEGNLVSNEYLELVLSVTDKFVFPGDETNLPKIRKFLNDNPILKDKWKPRWLPKDKFDFKINFYCFDDTVAFALGKFNEKDYLAYVLKNKEIAYSMKQLVELSWQNAHKVFGEDV